MNLSGKFVLSIALLCLLCFMLPGSLRADTVYTYTGNPFTVCIDQYGVGACSYPVSISFAVRSGTSLDNLSLANLDPFLDTFTMSDGWASINLWNYKWPSVEISTDAAGNITEWIVVASNDNSGNFNGYSVLMNYIASSSLSGPPPWVGAGDEAQFLTSEWFGNATYGGFGFNQNDPGTWSSAPSPEPSSILLLGTGILGLLAVMLKRIA